MFSENIFTHRFLIFDCPFLLCSLFCFLQKSCLSLSLLYLHHYLLLTQQRRLQVVQLLLALFYEDTSFLPASVCCLKVLKYVVRKRIPCLSVCNGVFSLQAFACFTWITAPGIVNILFSGCMNSNQFFIVPNKQQKKAWDAGVSF